MYTIGVDIGATKTGLALIDGRGQILRQEKRASTALLGQAGGPAAALAVALQDFCHSAQIAPGELQGIGIGIPGVVDRTRGVIASCPLLPMLDDCPLAHAVTAHLSIPTLVENDVNLIALGEHRYGRGQGIADLAVVFVGSGIGCGLILNGALYGGADGAAAEFGHTVIEPNGLPCPCGNVGCLELYCSGAALTKQAKTLLGDTIASNAPLSSPWQLAESVITAARQGQPAAQTALQQLGHYLGLGLLNLANLLNPRLILLGGGIVTGWPESVTVARQVVYSRARIVVRDRLVIEQAVLGEQAGLLGAHAFVQMQREGER